MPIRSTTAGARFFKRKTLEEGAAIEDALLRRALAGKCSQEEVFRQLHRIFLEWEQTKSEIARLRNQVIKLEAIRRDNAKEKGRREWEQQRITQLAQKKQKRRTLRKEWAQEVKSTYKPMTKNELTQLIELIVLTPNAEKENQ